MKNSFSAAWGNKTIWLEAESIPENLKELERLISPRIMLKIKNQVNFQGFYNQLSNIKKKANKIKKGVILKYGGEKAAYIFPLRIENYTFGYIAILNINRITIEKHTSILNNYVQTLILKIQNDVELSRLYETIQPRTAALSTIHTIHRLMNTSLSLKELLPRLARLSLQLMRVKRCSIYLLEKSKKYLRPAAIVTEKEQIVNRHKIKINEGIVGRAAKMALPILAEDSLAMPLIEEDVLGVIVVSNKIGNKAFNYFDQEILTTLSEQAVIAIKNAKLHNQQENMTLGSIKSLSALLGAGIKESDPVPQVKIKKLVSAIAKELNLPRHEINALNHAAMLHDIGKVSIPEKVLKKNTSLTKQEFKMVKEYPTKSAFILKHIKVLEPAIPIILYHHEKYNGSGYPEGLKEKEIPIGARILSVADAFEAMIAKKPYRRAKSIEQAVEEIKRNSGTQFDPDIVRVFLKIIKRTKRTKK